MLFRQMKYFAAVVECSSFTEAAERCYISQSAISQQIRSLEKELGVELILNDQRRAFSDVYVNFELMQCGCYAELSIQNPLSKKKKIRLEELRQPPCILISSREQQNAEQGRQLIFYKIIVTFKMTVYFSYFYFLHTNISFSI